MWRAGADGLWSRELAEAAAAAGETASGSMEESCDNPAAFLLEFRDGFKATLLQLNGYAKEWSYAARDDGQILATGLRTHGPPYPHFSYLGLNIEAMFLSGEPQYPVERTLLVSGALDALMNSRHGGIFGWRRCISTWRTAPMRLCPFGRLTRCRRELARCRLIGFSEDWLVRNKKLIEDRF